MEVQRSSARKRIREAARRSARGSQALSSRAQWFDGGSMLGCDICLLYWNELGATLSAAITRVIPKKADKTVEPARSCYS